MAGYVAHLVLNDVIRSLIQLLRLTYGIENPCGRKHVQADR